MSATTSLKTFLWFPGNLGEALHFYKGLFNENLVIHSAGHPEPDGKLMTADFSIFGQEFIGMGWPGGPQFNDSISLSINCDGQDQVDYYWDSITERGKAGQCGWCVDEFGLSWQVSPIQMRDHLQNPDPQKSAFAWQAMRGMTKIVIQDLIKND
jgi:predicted 3-demethylubiquinone-9 3-methyltransferase (glyoxalase superfamily)